MIEYALLIMLGFCIGGLIAFLLAPTLWHRAVRLTTKRLESTMPMSLSEIEADKDLLRASYAVRIRRLETGLNKARDKSANQLVEISKLQMQIGELHGEIAALNGQLDERRNAANVFENTIRKRFPELEAMVATAKTALDDRAYQIEDLNNKLIRREEMLSMTQRAANLQQNEIRQLRGTLEKSGSDTTGRFKRRPSQWTLEDYRSEYDRLNVELSKIREQLILAQERESRQTAVLKTELQQLAERIMAAAVPQERPVPDSREPERERQVPQERSRPMEGPAHGAGAARSPVRSQPWRGEGASDTSAVSRGSHPLRGTLPEAKTPGEVKSEARLAPAPNDASVTAVSKGQTTLLDESVIGQGAAEQQTGDDAASAEQQTTQDALKSLLNRRPRMTGKDLFDDADSESSAMDAAEQASHSLEESDRPPTIPAGGPADQQARIGEAGAVKSAPDARDPTGAAASVSAEPKLDQVFREILEGRSASRTEASPTPSKADTETNANNAPNASKELSLESPAPRQAAEPSNTKTLLDRLRFIQERQTG